MLTPIQMGVYTAMSADMPQGFNILEMLFSLLMLAMSLFLLSIAVWGLTTAADVVRDWFRGDRKC